jgi:hypothetical protein
MSRVLGDGIVRCANTGIRNRRPAVRSLCDELILTGNSTDARESVLVVTEGVNNLWGFMDKKVPADEREVEEELCELPSLWG